VPIGIACVAPGCATTRGKLKAATWLAQPAADAWLPVRMGLDAAGAAARRSSA
jgi:hypothetical protein